MPSVLAIAPVPAEREGRHMLSERLTLELRFAAGPALKEAQELAFDLLVLGGMTVDEQQAVAAAFQQHPHWRFVPILYLCDPESGGIAVPPGYRAGVDSLLRGELFSPAVQHRIRMLAREGMSATEMVAAGPFELDPERGRFRIGGREIALTEREAGVLALLLSRPNEVVEASEIIERGWGMEVDARYLQMLRRHVSNLRRKLAGTPAAKSVRTVRGTGYRFDLHREGHWPARLP